MTKRILIKPTNKKRSKEELLSIQGFILAQGFINSFTDDKDEYTEEIKLFVEQLNQTLSINKVSWEVIHRISLSIEFQEAIKKFYSICSELEITKIENIIFATKMCMKNPKIRKYPQLATATTKAYYNIRKRNNQEDMDDLNMCDKFAKKFYGMD